VANKRAATKKKGAGRGGKLTIIFAASEAVPFSKTGGLADVAGALPTALAAMGHDVHLFTPLYQSVDRAALPLPKKGTPLSIPISSRTVEGIIRSCQSRGMTVHFVENHHYYGRDGLYQNADGDFPDNLERFVFFSRAILEGTQKLKLRPDVIHLNDWQTALAPVYLKTLYRDVPAFADALTLLTIHNLGYQGKFWFRDWHITGLDWSLFHPSYLEFYGDINLLKGGILFSDLITTVSPTYANEIQTAEQGFGMQSILHERREDLKGLLNGVDTDVWNPETDTFIPANFSRHDLTGKEICKRELVAEMGLEQGEGPLFGVVSRLAEQKGFDLLLPLLDGILDAGGRLVLIGTGARELEQGFTHLAARRPDKAAVRLVYDERLAHMVEAGSDIFLMPSRYEPCGLNQLYSLRYGTAPLVRATGGLNDSVHNFDPETGAGNGFTFGPANADALMAAVRWAMELYSTDKKGWRKMIDNGMKADCGWDHSAEAYVALYRQRIVQPS